MGFLQDKKILVTGLLSNRSIAYGIAQALSREGAALAFTYQSADLKERVEKLAAHFGSVPVLPCDVSRDDEIEQLFTSLRQHWDGLDGIVHSIAFAPREALKGGIPGGSHARSVSHRARRQRLQFRRPRESGRADDAGPSSRAAHPELPRRAARSAELQRDGAREGEPRSDGSLSRAGSRTRRAYA